MKKIKILWIGFFIIIFLIIYCFIFDRIQILNEIDEKLSDTIKKEEFLEEELSKTNKQLYVYEQKYNCVKNVKKERFNNLFELENYINNLLEESNLALEEISRVEIKLPKAIITYKVMGNDIINFLKKIENSKKIINLKYFLIEKEKNMRFIFKIYFEMENKPEDKKKIIKKINFNGKDYKIEINHLGEKKIDFWEEL